MGMLRQKATAIATLDQAVAVTAIQEDPTAVALSEIAEALLVAAVLSEIAEILPAAAVPSETVEALHAVAVHSAEATVVEATAAEDIAVEDIAVVEAARSADIVKIRTSAFIIR